VGDGSAVECLEEIMKKRLGLIGESKKFELFSSRRL
jgi:hypothetical protein